MWSVLGTRVNPVETDEPIEMPFGPQTRSPNEPIKKAQKAQKSAALMCYGIILSERYSTDAGGKAPSACSFTQDVCPCISS